MTTIICHRGMWSKPQEHNTMAALEASFRHGFGIETDIRWAGGEIVLSHDLVRGGEPTFAELLDIRRRYPSGPLALNIKEDGLVTPLLGHLRDGDDCDYFVFDMSGPETVVYSRAGAWYFTRQSELEPDPILYDGASGVWLDCFDGEWFDEDVLVGHLERGKRVCVVSPELHRRDHQTIWTQWSEWDAFRSPDVLLCTDHPLDAARSFGAG